MESGGECEQHAGLAVWREQQAVLKRYKANPPIVGRWRLVRLRRDAEGKWGFKMGMHRVSCEGYALCVTGTGHCWDKGLRPHQRIINANGVDLKGMAYDDILALIQGTVDDALCLVVVEPANGYGYQTQEDVAREQWAEDARLAAERRAARRVELQEAARRVVSGVRREALEKARREQKEREAEEREAEERERYEQAKRDREQQEEWIREAEERARARRRSQCWGWLKWGRMKRAARPATGVLEPLLAIAENPMFAPEHEHQD